MTIHKHNETLMTGLYMSYIKIHGVRNIHPSVIVINGVTHYDFSYDSGKEVWQSSSFLDKMTHDMYILFKFITL